MNLWENKDSQIDNIISVYIINASFNTGMWYTHFFHYENLVYKNHQAQILVQNFSEHSKELEHTLSQAF